MEIRKYVALEDILGVRIECRVCHAVVVVGLDFYFTNGTNVSFLNNSPCCGANWTNPVVEQQLGSDVTIRHFVQKLNTIKSDTRYLLTFEIKQDKVMGSQDNKTA